MLYTIGHSTRTYAELVEVLRAWEVTRLIDIRSITRSRTNPQFNEPRLIRQLPTKAIAYEVMLDLGGRRPRSKIADPARNAGWRVQSFHNYADYAESPPFARALARGAKVSHIFTTAKIERAIRTPFAKLDRKTKTLRYPPVL